MSREFLNASFLRHFVGDMNEEESFVPVVVLVDGQRRLLIDARDENGLVLELAPRTVLSESEVRGA